jgi:hypothetical protein
MIASIVQIAGAVTISIGIGLVFIPAGVVTAGFLAVLFGISLERR